VAFFDVLNYAPTWVECTAWLEWDGGGGIDRQAEPSASELIEVRDALVFDGRLEFAFGRVALQGRLVSLASLITHRMPFLARKLRNAKRAVRWMLRCSGIRFVALVNTTAIGNARDEGDLDFFVIAKRGTIWSARLISGFPYRIFGRLSGANAVPDAVCLSYFITDDALDLSSHTIKPDDPYYRYWFLSMLPLYDDGVSEELWNTNTLIRERHPFATRWEMASDFCVRAPILRLPSFRWFERIARGFQFGWFPKQIADRMNRDTSVLVTDSVLKFHVDDRRAEYRQEYLERLSAVNKLMSQ
jgi:hypothetical protein